MEIPYRDAGRMVFSVGDALADALVRAGAVVVVPILGQDGAQVGLAEDQHAVQEFAAQRADEALAGRVGQRRQRHPVQMTGTGVCG